MTPHKPSIVFLSSYPPRECGIATFTQDLFRACQKVAGLEYRLKVCAINLSPLDIYKYPKEVVWKIDQETNSDYLRLAKEINDDPAIVSVIIEHEYGIFGGPDGKSILLFMRLCKKPMFVTLHTVTQEVSESKKIVTAEIIKRARGIIVLTKASKNTLKRLYTAPDGKIVVIPHGIHPVPFSTQKEYKKKLDLSGHIILSTFGLLGRRKGIEYAIRALPEAIKDHPSILYLVLGETHPVTRLKEGEEYRLELLALVKELQLEAHVKFYNKYLSLHDLLNFLQATDIYIAPPINPFQTVSGTLSYALGTGRVVICTDFTHAKEVVTQDVGRRVPVQNSRAISQAISELLSDPEKLRSMERYAYDNTREMLWSNVARKYIQLLTKSIHPKV